jgi:hypothetical protein
MEAKWDKISAARCLVCTCIDPKRTMCPGCLVLSNQSRIASSLKELEFCLVCGGKAKLHKDLERVCRRLKKSEDQ